MKKIWIVDDDEEMAKAIQLMLKMLDYETRHFFNARSGAQALLEGKRPDLLILDINMPEVSGLDMLEFVRRRPEWKDLPVIMLSSEAADVQVDKALSLGADAYAFKPVMIDELEAALTRLSSTIRCNKNLYKGFKQEEQMASKTAKPKTNSKSKEDARQKRLKWLQIAFLVISAMLILSMILTAVINI